MPIAGQIPCSKDNVKQLRRTIQQFTNRLATQELPVQSEPNANLLPNAMRRMDDTTNSRLKQLERTIFCPPLDFAVKSYHM